MNVITRDDLAAIAASAVPDHRSVHSQARCVQCHAVISAHPLHAHFAYLYVLCDSSLVRIIKPGEFKGGVKRTFGGKVER